jgi:hypothetical protein
MKKIFLFLIFIIPVGINQNSFASLERINSTDVYVNGYYKNNGNYVNPYFRSIPNSWTNYDAAPIEIQIYKDFENWAKTLNNSYEKTINDSYDNHINNLNNIDLTRTYITPIYTNSG